ncbi:nitroreductase [Tamaricihabitans halophyticus]|uniref:Nitroreductase n=1 Tax=Tamaricihabitans halophyticus TaxID=1262583 RepID=A0A4R2QYS1_9PSEU|nr:nitroreductase family protein [Tamaricihabitans halophyticus]TCP54208.1 nitroreductase [Tamaricihabitans halophyticus]
MSAELPSKPPETSEPFHELLAARWSPRAFRTDIEVTDRQLRALLEAARWAASSGNTQPARYLVGKRGTGTFDRILGTLSGGNKVWAQRAGVLLIGVAVTENAKGTIPLAEYGLALATQNLVLQAVAEGLVAHQMSGFDPAAAHREFALPAHAAPLVAIAVGAQAEPEALEDEKLISRERAPRNRIPLSELAFTGTWNEPTFPA